MKMKKLLVITAFAIGTALTCQAATYSWGMNADASLSSYSGDTIYVLSSAFEWSDKDTTLTDVQSAAVSSASVVSAGRGKYYVPTTKFSDTKDIPTTYNALFVLVDGDGKYVKWTDTLTGNDATDSNPVTLSYTSANLASFTSAQGGAKAFGAVPEPTSGLLMLLGLAGLALKRKRQ